MLSQYLVLLPEKALFTLSGNITIPFKLMDEDLYILENLEKEKRPFCDHQTLPHGWSCCISLSCAVAGTYRWLQQVRPVSIVIIRSRSQVCPHACFVSSWLTPLRSLLRRHRSRHPLPRVWELQWESHSHAALCREKCGCKTHCRKRHRTHTPQTPAFISIHGFLIGWWGPFF